jgi:hypothetical protein
MNSRDAEPMMSLDKLIEQTGLSAVTVWRYRKKGMLNTVNICGRQYIFEQRPRVLINVRLPVNLLSHQLDPRSDGAATLYFSVLGLGSFFTGVALHKDFPTHDNLVVS